MQYINRYSSPIGDITLASENNNLIGLWFDGQKYFASNLLHDCIEKELPIFIQTKKWLDIYFSGKEPNFTPTLSFDNASKFRKQVWEVLLKIPFGKTTTYKKIAEQLENQTGKKISAQAVGNAVGHNPISIIVPCHRVIGTNKNLTGYAGGIDKKIKLLQVENINTSTLLMPIIKNLIE